MNPEKSQSPRILFFGSGPFALAVLDSLASRYPIAGVVTQPDRPAGRGRRLERGAVAGRADALGIPVQQPETFKDRAALSGVGQLKPDVLIVASYGRILPRAVLDLPARGSLNLHPSLLPRHRGPSPVAGAILSGDQVTGVTVMEMVSKMDAGPIVAQRSIPVEPHDTAETLTAKLAPANADLLLESLPEWLAGTFHALAQDESKATYTQLLTKEMGRIDWRKSAVELAREVRAFIPWPVAQASFDGRDVRILAAYPDDQTDWPKREPGDLVSLDAQGILVQTGCGVLRVTKLQPAGGRPMPAADYARGHLRGPALDS